MGSRPLRHLVGTSEGVSLPVATTLKMGSAMAAARSANHIKIDLVSRLVSPRVRRIISILSSLFTAAVSFTVAYYCLEFVKIEYEFGSKVLDGKKSEW